MRRLVSSASLLLLSLACLIAQSPDVEAMTKALGGVGSSVVATFAANTTIPTCQLDGVNVEQYSSGGSVRARISYLRSDVWEMGQRLSNPPTEGQSFLQRLLASASSRLSPITKMAVQSIDSLGLEKGDLILDGTLAFEGHGRADDLPSLLLSIYITRNYSAVDFSVSVSLVVSGRLFPSPLAFEGLIRIVGDDESDCITLTTEKMTCNNFDLDIAPMYFSIT